VVNAIRVFRYIYIHVYTIRTCMFDVLWVRSLGLENGLIYMYVCVHTHI